MIIKLYETKNSGGCGKIVGEVFCGGEIERINPLDLFGENTEYFQRLLKNGCLTRHEFIKYSNGKNCSGLILQRPVRYSTPEELPDGIKAPQSWRYYEDYIIMSFHKIYSDSILNGTKTIEFRNRAPRL